MTRKKPYWRKIQVEIPEELFQWLRESAKKERTTAARVGGNLLESAIYRAIDSE